LKKNEFKKEEFWLCNLVSPEEESRQKRTAETISELQFTKEEEEVVEGEDNIGRR
jgi:hypothetical protein